MPSVFSNKTLTKLKQIANQTWTSVLAREQINTREINRQLQDKIFQNRIDSPLIFEWFYNIKRKQLEEEMYYSIEKLVDEYKTTNAIK